jgi:hypothetical protein
MTVIELSDRQTDALRARAAAQGLSLEAWLNEWAGEETRPAEPRSPQEEVERILKLQNRVKPDPQGWTVHDYINHDRP